MVKCIFLVQGGGGRRVLKIIKKAITLPINCKFFCQMFTFNSKLHIWLSYPKNIGSGAIPGLMLVLGLLEMICVGVFPQIITPAGGGL